MSLSEQDKDRILSLHNDERKSVNPDAPALKWDADLAAGAQAWVEGGGSQGDHDPDNNEGENMAYGSAMSVAEGVQLWMGEKSEYHGEAIDDNNYLAFGHYTQMVWRMSDRIGCGYVTNANGTVLCCRYSPPANMMGYTIHDTYGT